MQEPIVVKRLTSNLPNYVDSLHVYENWHPNHRRVPRFFNISWFATLLICTVTISPLRNYLPVVLVLILLLACYYLLIAVFQFVVLLFQRWVWIFPNVQIIGYDTKHGYLTIYEEKKTFLTQIFPQNIRVDRVYHIREVVSPRVRHRFYRKNPAGIQIEFEYRDSRHTLIVPDMESAYFLIQEIQFYQASFDGDFVDVAYMIGKQAIMNVSGKQREQHHSIVKN